MKFPLTELGRRAGMTGVAVVTVAAGAAVGLAAERYAVGRSWRGKPDPCADEPFGVTVGRTRTVAADDGVPLFVEVVDWTGSGDAPVTVVLVHGYALTLDCWHYQRRAFRDVGTVLLYDQRGHGQSGRGPADHATFEQLGSDLHRVLAECVPEGPVVLIGHSMGGMAVMAYAEAYPEMFGDRVVGVALLATSPGRLAEVTLGVPAAIARVVHRVAPSAVRFVSKQSELVERGRRAGSDLSYVLTKRYSFASDVAPSLVRFVTEMIASTPIEVLAEFFPAFNKHDRVFALDVINSVEALVMVGDGDLMTPASHSDEIIDRVPGAEAIVIADAGHLLMLEYPRLVNDHLRAFVARAMRATAAP